ncbi:glycosyltransferase [Stenotrophomonas sp. PA-6-5C]|uniref:glycosyltransferase n=1 Tax=Stenotrophomonas sp. PA-6-5C TaxID=2665487 RepID=UPI001F3A41E0|nr:glycosyltransferase [Stenotrophomonas sp. PA-6-5C]MCF5088779.1 glycosyltransferase [Stenotrophomonas sp. PA-6-5C]
MRVLIVHNYYQQAGGEDSVVRNEAELLRANGHEVKLYAVSNHSIQGFASKIIATVNAIFSIPSYLRIRKEISEFRPDVVHVHNFFPLISPSVFYACRAKKVRSVFTLHNYRIVCPTATLYFDGEVTERSIDEGPWWTVARRVYRNSFIGTFSIAASVSLHRRLGTWKKVDQFIALTEFAKSLFSRAGIPSSKIRVKSNFSHLEIEEFPEQGVRDGYLFVGRLTEDKGIHVLLEAARSADVTVTVIGDGPLSDIVSASKHINFLGKRDSSIIRSEMRKAKALIVPSLWYEGFPMVIAEAYSQGLPVFASDIGALSELIEPEVTGELFSPGSPDELAALLISHKNSEHRIARMSSGARNHYLDSYSPEVSLRTLLSAYNSEQPL